MGKRTHLITQAAIVVAVLAAWQGVSTFGIVSQVLLPPFSTVAQHVAALLAGGDFLGELGVTSGEVLLACVIVAPLGVGLGLLLRENEYIGAAFRPVFYFWTSVPKSVFLPIFILLFGIGLSEKVAFGVFQALFVLIIATEAAGASVSADLVRVAQANGATHWQVYREIYWPSMLPLVLEGMRLGVIFNITGVIFAEMYVSRAGIGSKIAEWGREFDMPDLLAGVLLTAVLSIAVNESLRWYTPNLQDSACATRGVSDSIGVWREQC